nr:hypothetical protein [uncultured Bacteroides sp.]
MTRIFFFSILIFMTLLVSCNRQTTCEKNFVQDSVSSEKGDLTKSDFDKFKSKFSPLVISDFYRADSSILNNYATSSDDDFVVVEEKYKKEFLPNVDTTYIYYGYKTELPNKCTILKFINHCGKKTPIDSYEVIDTTFITNIIYNNSGKILGLFRTFGSNLTGEPPTYSMKSTFEYKKDKLIISSHEYSTGKSYMDADRIVGNDSLYQADLIVTKFLIDYNTGKIKILVKSKKKAIVAESSSSIFLRPMN